MNAKECDRESRRDTWFENRLVCHSFRHKDGFTYNARKMWYNKAHSPELPKLCKCATFFGQFLGIMQVLLQFGYTSFENLLCSRQFAVNLL